MKNMPQVGDKVLLVQIGREVYALPKGSTPVEGDNIAVWQLGDGRLVTTGKSKAVVDNQAIIYPKQFANNNGNEVIAITSNPGCVNFGELEVEDVESGETRIFNLTPPSWGIDEELEEITVFISTIPSNSVVESRIWGTWRIIDDEDYVWKEREYHGEGPFHGEILGTTIIPLNKQDELRITVSENGDGKIGIEGVEQTVKVFGMCQGTPV